MKSKNISVNIQKANKLPFKETYVVFYKSKNQVKIEQKFLDKNKNQRILLNFRECERLMNLLNENIFAGNYKPKHGKMEIFQEED